MIARLALAVVSAAVLAFEILLVRLFAIVQWHHFAFMAISIALLGFGVSGTLLALTQHWARLRFTPLFAASASLFAVTAPASFLLAQALPFNALAVVWEPAQLFYLPAMYLLLVIPFVFGANCIGLAFLRFGEEAGPVYAYNLIGSAVGAAAIVAALLVLAPQDVLRPVAVLGFAAGAIAMLERPSAGRSAIAAAALVLGLGCALLPEQWLALRISEFKGLPQALAVSGARVATERSGPLGLLTVVESPEVPLRYVPGLSLNAPLPPPQRGVFVDGDSLTAIAWFDGRIASLAYLDHTTDALPYHLLARPEALILGAGGGQGVLQAFAHGASRIDAVDADPNMIRLVAEDHAAFAGRPFERPEVHVHAADARAFVQASGRQWDLLQLASLGGSGGALGGLSESYVYTVEAFAAYLDHLRPGGWLSTTRPLKLPPRDSLKLFATALDALARLGAAAPQNHLILLRGLTTTTLLVKNGEPLSAEDVARAKAFAEARAFDLAYYPGITATEANRFNVLEHPYFFEGAVALAGPGRASFLARYKFDLDPATDDRPYFDDFLKWRTLPELLETARAGGSGLLELGGVVLAATFVQATVLSVILILVPLLVRRRALVRTGAVPRVGAYFLALGLAFLFIEIAFIQRFVLFLGHPLYAVAFVIAAFLLFAGMGSAAAPALARRLAARPWPALGSSAVALAVAAIVAVSLFYVLALPGIFALLLLLPDAVKLVAALVLVGPLAFFMGMPFPLGLARVAAEAPSLVPWAWGVNGCASVLSALLAAGLAMELGFSAVVVAAALLYAGAAAVYGGPLADDGR